MDIVKDTAGFDRHRIVVGVDFTYPVHPFQGKHDRLAGVVRDTAQYQTGIATLGDDGNLVQFAEPHDFRDLLGMSGQHDSQCLSGEPFPVIGHEREHFRGIGNDMVTADQFFTEFDERWLCHGMIAVVRAFPDFRLKRA